MSLPMMPHAMRVLPPDACPYCGSTDGDVGIRVCECGRVRDSVVEMVLRRRQTEARVERHRDRLIGQGSLVERIADDRRTYGGGPREIRE